MNRLRIVYSGSFQFRHTYTTSKQFDLRHVQNQHYVYVDFPYIYIVKKLPVS